MENTAIAVSQQSSEVEAPRWGAANPLRGANYNELALSFARAYPVGSTLMPDDFDKWAVSSGGYTHSVPAETERKGADGHSSDRWLAHLQRRHQLRANVNKAGAHTRISSHGARPFIITQEGRGLVVRSPEVALAKNDMTKRVTSLCGHKRKNLAYLMQSADWEVLPPHERAIAEALYDDIDKFERDISSNAEWLTNKFVKLEQKIRRACESGRIQPQNGGISRLLSDEQDNGEE